MPISVNIEANSPEEYKALVAALTAGKIEQHWQTTFRPAPDAEPVPEPVPEMPSAVEDVTAEAVAAADAPAVIEETPAPKRRGRKPKGTPSEYPSPNQTTVATAPDAESEDADAAGPTPEEAEDLFAPDPVATAPTDTNKVDMEMALEELRILYDRPGMPAKANDLLAKYGVKKFSLIPEDKGTELLAVVRQMSKDNPA